MLKRIGAEEGGEFKAIASGTLPCGKPVVVNADGTVSVVSETAAGFGSSAVFESASSSYFRAAFDSSSGKVIIAYRDVGNSNYGTAVVGTVSDRSISFGTPVVFEAAQIGADDGGVAVVYDPDNNKTVICYGITNNGKAIVGTVSGTSISFGTAVQFEAARADYLDATYDTTENRVVIAYRDDGNSSYGTAVVGNVSGTSISFGTPVVFESANSRDMGIVHDSYANRVVVAYMDVGNSFRGTARVGSVDPSNNSISFGSATVYDSTGFTFWNRIIFDSSANKVVIVYQVSNDSNKGKAIVGTTGASTISFGSEAIFNNTTTSFPGVTFDSTANKVMIVYRNDGGSYYGTLIEGTVSGTSISFGTPVTYLAQQSDYNFAVYDSTNNKTVVIYRDPATNSYGNAIVYGQLSQNLTSENYIGMSSGTALETGSAASAGTPVVFEAADTQSISATFDSSNNKVVVAYMDNGNSSQGTAIVGTVSGESISFGSPVVYTSGNPNPVSATFDSNSNKVVFCYRDTGNSNQGTAIVGTVSGTSISFGSPVIFETGHADHIAATFDSSSNKVVIAFRDYDDSTKGKAIVGTVSGTSISFGSTAVFKNSSIAGEIGIAFDSSNNKIVVSYRDSGNNNYGTAKVGTVSGTDISFSGSSDIVFNSNIANLNKIVFDSSNNKIVIVYYDQSQSYQGQAIVGTISGVSISFGSEATFETGYAFDISATFDSNSNKVNIAYRDVNNSDYGTMAIGTVSGTSISFATPVVYETAKAEAQSAVFDSSNNRVVVSYKDNGNSNHGTSVVFKNDDSGVTRGEVADGGHAFVDIIGSVSDNQLSLTAGQQYFVQNDGTISTTADSPSVLAGTAISATELVVKT